MSKKDTKSHKVKGLFCYDDVMAMIRAGAGPAIIARYVQEDAREMLDVNRRSCEQAIRRFIADLPPGIALTRDPKVAEVIDLKKPPKYVERLREAVEEGLNILVEQEELYRKQLARVEQFMMVESKLLRPIESLRKEIELACKILTDYAKIALDTGVMTRVPMQADFTMKRRNEVDVGANLLQLLMQKGLDVDSMLKSGEIVEADFVKLLSSPEDMKKVIREGLIDGE